MTLHRSLSAPASIAASRVTPAVGGGGFVAAGVLQVIGALRLAAASGSDGGAATWQLLSWPVGGIVLLLASTVLATGWRGEVGLVGRSRSRRAALIVSGAQPVILIAVFVLAWTVGPILWSLTTPILGALQLLTLAATAVVAVTVLRAGAMSGAARWAFAALAGVDAVALGCAVVPQTSVAYQFVVAGIRPVAVIVVGVLLVFQGRALRAGTGWSVI